MNSKTYVMNNVSLKYFYKKAKIPHFGIAFEIAAKLLFHMWFKYSLFYKKISFLRVFTFPV